MASKTDKTAEIDTAAAAPVEAAPEARHTPAPWLDALPTPDAADGDAVARVNDVAAALAAAAKAADGAA